MSKKRKVLLIGWDAADWKVIDRLVANGRMPAMKKFLEEGTRGNLATLDPPLSPMLWTSMATGVRPYKHGILGFVDPVAETGGMRPVSTKSRKVRAIWNMFTLSDIKSNVVGWWPSNPVEPINGCMVSNLYHVERKGGTTMSIDEWDMAPGTIHPASLEESLKELRVHPSEITGNLVIPFVPNAIELDKKQDSRLNIIAKYLAHATSVHAACTELMETQDWDFTAVYHDAIDHYSHAFMRYYPPKLEWVDDDDYLLFKDAVVGAYIYHDMMLERLLDMVDDDTTVMIVSDHGFHSDNLRPRFVPDVPSGPAVEHAPFGIVAVKGPGIKKGATIFGASVLDITPTLLTMYDLPVGKDMDGKVLANIFEETPEVKYIDSWEQVEGFDGGLSGDEKDDPIAEQAAMQQLIDLGYIADPAESGDSKYKSKAIAVENSFYLAKSYSNAGKYHEAYPILKDILESAPKDYRYLIEMVHVLIKIKNVKEAQSYLKVIDDNKLIASAYYNVLKARVAFLDNDPAESVRLLREAAEKEIGSPAINVELGKSLTVISEFEEAIAAFQKAIKTDPLNQHAHHGIGLANLRQGNYENALEHFLKAIEISYHYPYAHLHLGETLLYMGEYIHAKTAFEQVTIMLPSLKKSYKWLLEIAKLNGDKAGISKYQSICNEFITSNVKIITGLPSDLKDQFMEKLANSGINISNVQEDYAQGEKLNEDYFKSFENEVLHIPYHLIGQIPNSINYTIYNIEVNPINSIEYLKEKEDEAYDLGKITAYKNQCNSINLWFDQQPDIDLYRFSNINEFELLNKLIKDDQ